MFGEIGGLYCGFVGVGKVCLGLYFGALELLCGFCRFVITTIK